MITSAMATERNERAKPVGHATARNAASEAPPPAAGSRAWGCASLAGRGPRAASTLVNTYGRSATLASALHNALRVTEAVRGGEIDPLDPLLERMLEGSDQLIVVLQTSADRPAHAARWPGHRSRSG
jgi:hypothetical protein